MKYYIVAGEASGDLHAANLLKQLKQLDVSAQFRGWGGDLMEAQGCELVKHYRDLAFMGFIEVLMNIRTIKRNLKLCKQDVLEYKPDALILVDYPGFNLRIAEFAREHGIKVHYYISPQVWAWKQSRVKKIKRDVDRLYCVLPFEKDFYKKHNYDVSYVGHPLLDAIGNRREEQNVEELRSELGLDQRPVISLLPGSRKQEITTMLPIMLSVIEFFPNHQFVIAGAPSQTKEFYQNLAGDSVKFVSNRTYDLLMVSEAALVTSGTATLETALFNVPEVVCYKGSWVSYQIAKRLVKIEYISLVNLILDKPAVKELIQGELNTTQLTEELQGIIEGGEKRTAMLKDYSELQEKLGGGGASANVAQEIFNAIS